MVAETGSPEMRDISPKHSPSERVARISSPVCPPSRTTSTPLGDDVEGLAHVILTDDVRSRLYGTTLKKRDNLFQ